jgi:hypothetical protein
MFSDNYFWPLQLLVFIANRITTPFHLRAPFLRLLQMLLLVRVGAYYAHDISIYRGVSTIE